MPPASQIAAERSVSPDRVVLIHGLARRSGCFRRLRRRLEAVGYRTLGWDYPSIRRPVPQLGQDLAALLARLDADPSVGRVHLVTHSLGGIVVRQALTLAVPAKLGRVVMLAPPNRGSAWARRLTPVLGRWMVNLPLLSDVPGSFVNRLPSPPPGVPIAIIAGRHDGKCPPPQTHLPAEAAHFVVPCFHTWIMYRYDVAEIVLSFLAR